MGIGAAFHLLPLPQAKLTMAAEVQSKSILTCPECGHKAELVMPSDACLFFHECEACKAVLSPLKRYPI